MNETKNLAAEADLIRRARKDIAVDTRYQDCDNRRDIWRIEARKS